MKTVLPRYAIAVCCFALEACRPMASARAQSTRVDCGAAHTTLESRRCRSETLSNLEAATAAFQDSVYNSLDSVVTKPLHRADSAWVAYRNSECGAAANTEYPGTAVPVLDLQCRIDLTAARLRYLRATYRSWLKP